MGVGGSEPKKEWFILGAIGDVPDPVFFFSRTAASGDFIKGSVLISEHMIFPRENGVVTGFAEKLWKADLIIGKFDVQLGRAGIVGIPARDDAATARTATRSSEIGIGKTHSTRGEPVDARSFDMGMPVTTNVIEGHIIGDEENKIGPFVGVGKSERQGGENDEKDKSAW